MVIGKWRHRGHAMPKRYVVHDGVRLEHFRSGVAKQFVYTIWRGASA
jgi:hypothetical protein